MWCVYDLHKGGWMYFKNETEKLDDFFGDYSKLIKAIAFAYCIFMGISLWPTQIFKKQSYRTK